MNAHELNPFIRYIDLRHCSVSYKTPLKAYDYRLFTIVDGDSKTEYRVRTDKTVVGDALMELGLIEGEEGPYGLYVKKVGGILADYEETGTYWAFYVNGEYATSGVDLTEIEPGAAYAFKVEK